MAIEPQPSVTNANFLSKVASNDTGIKKQAERDLNDFVRMYQREEGFHEHIMPVEMLDSSNIERVDYTDKPVKFVDVEPGSPAAVAMTYAAGVSSRYIKGNRVAAVVQRVVGPKFMKDVDELKTYNIDIRQVLSDNSLKDVLAHIDNKHIAMWNVAMGGVAGQASPATGVIQWARNQRRIHRDSIVEATKIMGRCPQRAIPKIALINSISARDIQKFGREEMGGDMAQELFLNGITKFSLLGLDWVVTIKSDIVPENSMFLFAEPKRLGRSYSTQDLTMSVKVEDWMISFFGYKTIGSVTANPGAVVRMDFNTQQATSAGVDDGSGGIGGW